MVGEGEGEERRVASRGRGGRWRWKGSGNGWNVCRLCAEYQLVSPFSFATIGIKIGA